MNTGREDLNDVGRKDTVDRMIQRRRTSRVARLVLVPFVATALVLWWAIGDVSEAEGRDQITSFPWAQANSWVLGVVGLLLCVAVALDLVVNWAVMDHTRILWAVVFAIAAGGVLAVGLRILTAKVGGANIGGGIFILFGVPFVVVLLGIAVAAVFWATHFPKGRAGSPGGTSASDP